MDWEQTERRESQIGPGTPESGRVTFGPGTERSRGEPHVDQEQSLSLGEHETRNWEVRSMTRSRGAETVRRTGETDS